MNAYIDSSVVLRLILGQAGKLAEWRKIERGVASGLIEVECLRTIDTLRLESALNDDETAHRRELVFRILESATIIEPTSVVLHRAAQPMPTPLGTLDAIHLATAMLWREAHDDGIVIATHDRALGLAARASGFGVAGL